MPHQTPIKEVTGHVLGIWICGCSLFYRRSSRSQNSRILIVLKASYSAGAKGDVTKIYGFVHQLHRANAFPGLGQATLCWFAFTVDQP